MKRKNSRIMIGSVIIIGALVYFGVAGFQEGKAYYKTIAELQAMGEHAIDKRIRVGGVVTPGSIKRNGTELTFQLEQEDLTLQVRYTGTGSVPDTFQDRADALCDGTYGTDGIFEATQIQAKCASKYEAEYNTESSDV